MMPPSSSYRDTYITSLKEACHIFGVSITKSKEKNYRKKYQIAISNSRK
jgi:hypothetical protein